MSERTVDARRSRLAAASAVLVALGALAASLAWAGGSPAGGLAGRWALVAGLALWAFRRRSLTAWILVSMVVGAEVGHDWPATAVAMRLLSQIFIRMIKTIIAPLLFATLVVGIAGHPNLRHVGRMGIKALVYFEIVTTIALFIGLAAINLTRAGVGVQPPEGLQAAEAAAPRQTISEVILHAFPENVAKSVAEGQVLQIVLFSVLFAVALAMLTEQRRRPMLAFAESLAATMFKFTNIVMLFAPVGVGAAIAYTVGHMGLGILVNLAKALATFYLALLAFLLFVLLPVALLARVPLRRFVKAVAEPVSIAFATTSSEAALPLAMERMEEFGVPRQTVAFVMPTGYSFNLDGSTLYLALATVFVAQAAGIHLSFAQQLMIVFTLMLTSKGIAGVPRATLVILMGTATSFGLPEWPVLVLLGIDELTDMARTSVNVVGNCLATVVVARWEGDYPPPAQEAP
ncbi:MAG TPA: cation:dicarboxylase symporter family transporter [Vicinamibacteria bacterium]|nr:cation:dicarboxylase symporter family transporter [Vicinamibacteria bacterium]